MFPENEMLARHQELRELPSHLWANVESMMVGEPIILLSHGLKVNTEDRTLLDDLACAPIINL